MEKKKGWNWLLKGKRGRNGKGGWLGGRKVGKE